MTNPATHLVYIDLYQTASNVGASGRPQTWRWRAINAGNQFVLAESSEAYTNEDDCLSAITQLFGRASNVYLRQVEQGNRVLRLASDFFV